MENVRCLLSRRCHPPEASRKWPAVSLKAFYRRLSVSRRRGSEKSRCAFPLEMRIHVT
jgi:hypothetical protein